MDIEPGFDEWREEWYDETDMESVVLHGHEEDEDMDAGDAAFLRGYIEAGEL